MCHAVSQTTGIDAPSAKLSPCGSGSTIRSSTQTTSLWPPNFEVAITRSPLRSRGRSISPATS